MARGRLLEQEGETPEGSGKQQQEIGVEAAHGRRISGICRTILHFIVEHPRPAAVDTQAPTDWVAHTGGQSAPRTVTQGADTIVWLATLPDDGPSGLFFEDRKPIAW